MKRIMAVLASSILLGAGLSPATKAQQINGIPGSPSSTITIDGKQLPPPPTKFGGVIKESAKDSKPVAAARGAAERRAQCAAHHDRRPGLWR